MAMQALVSARQAPAVRRSLASGARFLSTRAAIARRGASVRTTVALQAPRHRVAPPTGFARRRCFSDFINDFEEGARLRLAFAAACLPHPDKVAKGGEDAYFASTARRAFAVADGVGGWAENGVDPGEFSRQLLRFSHEVFAESGDASTTVDLRKALHEGMRRLRGTSTQGGTTALLGQLTDNSLCILNLGDSGVMVLRPALRTPPGAGPLLFPRVVFRSSDQTHYFNCPYQLGSSAVPTEEPDIIRVLVRPGDLVVAGTDGVFDNLFDHQVQAIVARHLGNAWRTGASVEPHLQGLATSITKQAQRIGQQEDSKDVITPFALAAHSEGLPFRGGKLDDTTVVVGLVVVDEGSDACDPEKPPPEKADKLPEIHNFIR
mmetsp:Transcript_30970/g.65677  ORF Transcript_30970/g.65677 Transcript_30970/m.65677 type:complete len:377 (+) Transcript_30970:93-1223(+)